MSNDQKPKEALKYDNGKPPLSILTRESLNAEAAAFGYGEVKYGDRHNYKKHGGMDWSRLISASMRHITAFNDGETFDPESGLNHLWHAKACLAMLIYYVEKQTGNDDRFIEGPRPIAESEVLESGKVVNMDKPRG